MKTLVILRHGKSLWDNPQLKDFDRPLNARGENNANDMGFFLRQKAGCPDVIVSSAAKRALETAIRAAHGLEYAKNDILVKKELYLAPASTILQSLAQLPNHINSCLLVGHNPGLTDFINHLGVRLDNLPTASAACFEFDCQEWANIGKVNATFRWLQLAREL